MADVVLRGQVMTVAMKLVTEECYSCHVLFAITDDFKRERLRDKRTFYCPNGHGQCYQGKTEEQKLREQLDDERRKRQSAEQNVAYWADEARDAGERADKERRRANGYKGHATKLTKRVKAGVCICCNRTFADLARHMATKHPTLTPLELDASEKASLQ